MIVVSTCCLLLFLLCFKMTRETVKSMPKESSVGSDLKTLFRNAPWWILLGGVLFFNLFSAARYTAGPFFFASVIGDGAQLRIFSTEFLFYAGIFFAVGEISNMVGVSMTPFITSKLGKKSTFMYSLVLLIVLSCLFFFVPVLHSIPTGTTIIICACVASVIMAVAAPIEEEVKKLERA